MCNGLFSSEKPWQYSLRTLLVLVTLLNITFGVGVNRALNQRLAVRRVQTLGGYAIYDHQLPEATTSAVNHWFRSFFGNDIFATISIVQLPPDQATYERKQSGIHVGQALIAPACAVDDDRLWVISSLASLKSLDLSMTDIGNRGLMALRSLKRLEALNLSNTKVSDEGLRTVGSLISLKCLCLDDLNITRDGIRHLENLRDLNYLSLRRTRLRRSELHALQQRIPACTIHWDEPLNNED